uniref:GH16 domain-containing protein n=1 Tax=Plectus sambesii TaxID=2011161 RepID=A0A914XAA6_9BILA
MSALLLVGCLSVLASVAVAQVPPYEASSPPPSAQWNEVWREDFDSFDNNPKTNTRWSFDLGNDWQNTTLGWGNGEYEYYTTNPKNVRSENGTLIIEAQVETTNKPQSSNGVAFDLTSARIATRGHESWGVNMRFIARAKLPTARTTWPAFWMLPEPLYPGDPAATWPRGGELDIMEHWATPMNMVASSTHCLSTDGQSRKDTTKQVLHDNGQTYYADYHTYELQLRSDRLDYFLDDQWIYGLVKDGCLNSGIAWPWENRNFHILLNLALMEYGFDYQHNKQEIIDALNQAAPVTKQFIVDYISVQSLVQ